MTKRTFCREETKTGLAILYNTDNRRIGVVPACHPSGALSIQNKTAKCDYCANVFVGSVIEYAIKEWSTSWIIGTGFSDETAGGTVSDWVSGWTGIPTEDLNVKFVEEEEE
jgi:hypothetical protein